jgi:hypothetical protein
MNKNTISGTCILCGSVFTGNRSSKKYCSGRCRRRANLTAVKVVKPTKNIVCRVCGIHFLGHRNAKYCSPSCQTQGKINRSFIRSSIIYRTLICLECGIEFTPKFVTRPGKKPSFCSDRCNRIHGGLFTQSCPGPYLGSRAWSSNLRTCIKCSADFLARTSRCCFCSKECKYLTQLANYCHIVPTFVEKICPECDKPFPRTSSLEHKRYCSSDCRGRSQFRRRRAKLESAFVEDVGLGYLIKRDLGICQICKKKVNTRVRFPHPDSPSVDHVIPISKGGAHSKDNCQLAHYHCNCCKSATLITLF